jgi:hypothetical protein
MVQPGAFLADVPIEPTIAVDNPFANDNVLYRSSSRQSRVPACECLNVKPGTQLTRSQSNTIIICATLFLFSG